MAIIANCIFKQIYDPSDEYIVRWNNIMFVVGLINFSLDPIFLYLATVYKSNSVYFINVDLHFGAILAVLRCAGDLFFIWRIVMKFRTAYEAPGSRVFKRRRLVQDPRQIAIKYLRSTFIVDLLAALPMPQVYIWYQIHAPESATNSNLITRPYYGLCQIIALQFYPRLFVVVYSKTEIAKTAAILMKSSMSGAFYNLLWFMIHSNIIGATYYLFYTSWLVSCFGVVEQEYIVSGTFEWDQVITRCTKNDDIAEGMFSSALENKLGMRQFIQKFMFCFSWGLKGLSSLGQNFSTSFDISETIFSILITLYGLIFLADLITRMQASIQSMEEREEQQRTRQREVKEWMDYHQLPISLRERIDRAIQSEWSENGINDEAMLDSFPMGLRSEIRIYLYMDLICKLPKFADMDRELIEAICQHLRTFSSRQDTYIVYEGDPVKQMLFIFSGQLEITLRDSINSSIPVLGPGDSCGQELVTWASLSTTSLENLPSSTWTIKCLTNVEAFALEAYDMKILATQFAQDHEFQRAFKQHYP